MSVFGLRERKVWSEDLRWISLRAGTRKRKTRPFMLCSSFSISAIQMSLKKNKFNDGLLDLEVPFMEREMRIFMASSIDATPANLEKLGRYFFDPRSDEFPTPSGNVMRSTWNLHGGKEILRIMHTDHLSQSPWFQRFTMHLNFLSSLGKTIGLDEAFALFYLVEFPMFAVDFKFAESKVIQFGQIKVRDNLGDLQLIIGSNNCKEIRESKMDDEIQRAWYLAKLNKEMMFEAVNGKI